MNEKILGIFKTEALGHIEFLESIICSDTLESSVKSVEHRFHTIKGGASFLGLTAIAHLASECEKCARKEGLAELSLLIKKTLPELKEAVDQIKISTN